MAKVTFATGIKSVSGSVGNMTFVTRNGKSYVYRRVVKKNRPATPAEKARRRRFSIVAKIVRFVQAQCRDVKHATDIRKKLWDKVTYWYDKVLMQSPVITDKEMIDALMKHFSDEVSRQVTDKQPKND